MTPGGNGNWNQMELEDWDIFEELIVRPNASHFADTLSGATPWPLDEITIPQHVSIIGFVFTLDIFL